MGLDISYISKIKETRDEEPSFSTNYNGTFQYQLGSLKKFTCYDLTPESENGGFCAGSYSGYNQWRNQLAVVAGYESAEKVWEDCNLPASFNIRLFKLKEIDGQEIERMKPFYELINFSDCEGLIGPEICKKLYQDFVDFEDKAKEQDEYFYERYTNWKEAFRVASDNGLVAFH